MKPTFRYWQLRILYIFWSFVHNCLAHPLLFLLLEIRPVVWFHDKTANLWGMVVKELQGRTSNNWADR